MFVCIYSKCLLSDVLRNSADAEAGKHLYDTEDAADFMVSGSDDPVGGFGKGVRKIYEKYRAAGIQDVTLRLYAGDRHEIFEMKQTGEQVYQDLYEWMQSKMEV